MQEGRITEVHRTNYIIQAGDAERTATVRGVFHDEGAFPKVGDYVRFTLLEDGQAVIEQIKERTSVIKRKSASTDEEQVMAANVSLVFIVMGLDGDYNLSRLERYLQLASASDIPAVVLLNKTDVTNQLDERLQEVEAVAGTTRVIPISALSGEGLLMVKECFTPDTTAVLLGSSGAGKSTITNWLLGEDAQAVKETRADDSRGRHTTTSRQLFNLPFGGSLIDTPGMRELGVLDEEGSEKVSIFEKIETVALNCKFRNCDHEKSAGCAVLAALEAGELSIREFQNYQKLLKEQAFLRSKDSDNSARHFEQNKKRELQKNSAIARAKLSRRR